MEADGANVEAATEASRKRPAETPLEDDEDARGWKLRKKKVGPGFGEIYDPGLIPIKLKPKKEESPAIPGNIPVLGMGVGGMVAGTGSNVPQASEKPTWAPTKWKKAGEESSAPEPASIEQSVPSDPTAPALHQPGDVEQEALGVPSTSDIKREEATVGVKTEDDGPQSLPQSSSGASLFKKRRAPVGGGAGSRGRRL